MILKCTFSNFSLGDDVSIFKLIASKVNIIQSKFINGACATDLNASNAYLFDSVTTSYSVDSCEFSQLKCFNLFVFLSKTPSPIPIFFLVKSSIFKNLLNGVFLMREPFDSIRIEISIFQNITSGQNLVNLENTRKIYLNNVFFSKNTAKNNIYTKNSEIIEMINVTCFSNNYNIGKTTQNSSIWGACFFIENSISRNFTNLKIIKCFSNHTTAGLILVDEENFKNNLFSNDSYRIEIKDSHFFLNYVFIDIITSYHGASIYIDVLALVTINSSQFKYNLMETYIPDFTFTIFGGPCINSVHSHIIRILNSIFKLNKSTKLSNCLNIYSNILSIKSSIFLNNSIPSLSPDVIEYKRVTHFWLDQLDFPFEFSKLNNGGAVFYSGNDLEMNSSYFFGNVGGLGSVLYFDDRYSTQNTTLRLTKNFVTYNDGVITSGIIYLNNPKLKINLIIDNSYFFRNYGFNGGIINVFYPVKIFSQNNTFYNNSANCAVIFFFPMEAHNFFRQTI